MQKCYRGTVVLASIKPPQSDGPPADHTSTLSATTSLAIIVSISCSVNGLRYEAAFHRTESRRLREGANFFPIKTCNMPTLVYRCYAHVDPQRYDAGYCRTWSTILSVPCLYNITMLALDIRQRAKLQVQSSRSRLQQACVAYPKDVPTLQGSLMSKHLQPRSLDLAMGASTNESRNNPLKK
jgi:hypothetical protein